MFKKLLSKTTKKADDAIGKTAEDIGEVIAEAKQFIDDSKSKLKLISTLAIIGIVLGITADVVSIVVGARTVRLLDIKDIINK